MGEGARPVELSVVVVAGFRREFLPACIESIVRTTLDRARFEVLLAWGFEDAEWAARFRTLGVRLLPCPPGLREGEMLCEAIPHARGDVLVFMEDDDTFDLGKLARVAEVFRGNPRLAFYNHDERAIDARGNILGWIHSVNGFNLSSHAIRADLMRRHLGTLRELTAACDHYVYWVGRLFGEETLHEGRLLTGYRVHAKNFHVGKDPGPDYALLLATAKRARREGRPVGRALLELQVAHLLLKLARTLFPRVTYLRLARLLSQIAWLREVRRVVAHPERQGHPAGRPLIETI